MSIRLDFDLTGLDTLQRKLDSAVNRLVKDSCAATAKVVKARAKQGPFKDRTRQLRSTINDVHIGLRGGWYIVEVRAPQQYASFVELGTKEHDIWPKAGHNLKGPVREGQTRRATGKGPHEHIVGRGIALRWKDASGNQRFARMVHHPGSKPYAFMAPATEYGRAYITQFAQLGLVKIAAQLESYG